MPAITALLSLLLATAAPHPAVPGLCTAPASEHVGEAGCYLSVEFDLQSKASATYWHLYSFPDQATANAEAAKHADARVVKAHGRWWLHVLGTQTEKINGRHQETTAGPLHVPTGGQVRILESNFPPGMITRAHQHPGVEVFYVMEGEQCVETPQEKHLITAGQHYVLTHGPHLQSAPKGRRSVVLLILPKDVPWMSLETAWTPTGLCSD